MKPVPPADTPDGPVKVSVRHNQGKLAAINPLAMARDEDGIGFFPRWDIPKK